MGYPTKETISAFKDIVEKDGMEDIFHNLVELSKTNKKINPLIEYLKAMVFSMVDNGLDEELGAYTNGFISCLDLFRRQMDSESIDLEDLNIQLDNIVGWNSYLEDEVVKLNDKIKELENRLNQNHI